MKKLALFLSLACACTGHTILNPVPDPPGPEECTPYTNLFLSLFTPTAFPVEVVIDTNTPNHDISLILEAIDAWNARLGQEILYATITADLAGMHGMCNYTTVTTRLLPNDWVGLTVSTPCAAADVYIETMEVHKNDLTAVYFTDLVVTQIAMHELGHVLGVPHEEDPTSIMFPSLGYDVRSISAQSACMVWLALSRSST